jgi:hypothetical protein
MRRLTSFVLAGALLAGGCGASGTSPTPPTPADPLRLTATQMPGFIINGEPLTRFAVQLQNIGQTAVDLTFPSSCQILPAFLTRTGDAVTPVGGGLACATVITRVTLGPSQSVSQVFTVKAGTAPSGQDLVLPLGDYTFVARLDDTAYRLNSDPLLFSLR